MVARTHEEFIAYFKTKYVVDARGCWIWTGGRQRAGYGRIEFRDKQDGAHRVSYILFVGEIPQTEPKTCVCHTCDTPPCVNPAHLFLGTQTDNAQDSARKGRNVFQKHPEKRPRGEKHWLKKKPEMSRKGEQLPWTKLTAEKVIDIRRRIASGETCAALGREYGIALQSVWAIKHRHAWKHVP